MQRENAPFKLLFVCTGNICRSPIAEQLFNAGMKDLANVIEASSAGTSARSGAPMTDEAKGVSRFYGGAPDAHAATPLTVSLLTQSRLILTASRVHRAEVVSMVPRLSRNTFTIREFARLTDTLATYSSVAGPNAEAARPDLEDFVTAVGTMRGHGNSVASPVDDDIVDPYRQEMSVYEEAGQLIHGAVERVAEALRAVLSPLHIERRDDLSLNDKLANEQRDS